MLHPDTAHTGGPNYNYLLGEGDSHLRVMVYFRIKSCGVGLSGDGSAADPEPWETLVQRQKGDMYYDLPGLK